MMDLDNFKQINDTYGHQYGDSVLSNVGKILTQIFDKNSLVGRMGGDEFGVYVSHFESISALEEKIFNLRQKIAENYGNRKTTLSIGIAISPKDGNDFSKLYLSADKALYKAKNNGKNTYFFA